MVSGCTRGDLGWKDYESSEQNVCGSSWFTIPGGIQKICASGALRHGLVVDLGVLGWLDDLGGLFWPEWFCDANLWFLWYLW